LKTKIKDLAIGARFKLLDCEESDDGTQSNWDGISLFDKTWVLLKKYPKGRFEDGCGLIEQWTGPKTDRFNSRCIIVHDPTNLPDYEVWCVDYESGSNGQSKKKSFEEATVNMVVGFTLSFIASFLIFPLFGYKPTLFNNFFITVFFTLVTLLRTYLIRRFYNERN